MLTQFLSFIKKETIHIWRDKKTLLILFGMPIVMIVLFGFALTNEVKNSRVGILDPSKDNYSRQLTDRFEGSRYFEVVALLQSQQEIDEAFKAGTINLAVVFPSRFEETLLQNNHAQIQFIADATDPNIATTLIAYAGAVVHDFQAGLFNSIPYAIRTEVRMLYNPQLVGAFNFVPGVMGIILMLLCTLMTSVSIVREKENGTMEVLLASPAKPIIIILAKAIPYLVLSLINVGSILVMSRFVLGLPIQGSLLLLLSVSLLFTVTSLALGLLISTLTNSQQIAMMVAMVGTFMPTIMFSGFLFPIENFPFALQLFAKALPTTWYFIMVKSVMLKGLGLHAIWREVAILSGMTLVLLTISAKLFKARLE